MKEIKKKIKDSIFGDFNQELIGDKVTLQNKVNKLQRMIDMINYLQPVQEEEEFVLPEKWCVKHSKETLDWIRKNAEHYGEYITKCDYYNYPCDVRCNNSSYIVPLGYTKISVEQFKKYVLNK